MSSEPNIKDNSTAVGAAFAVALLIGVTVGFLTKDFMNAVFTILIVSGVSLAVLFHLRDKRKDSSGPSEFGAAVMGGVLLAGIGACGFVHYFTQDVTITAVCLIGVFIAASLVMVTEGVSDSR